MDACALLALLRNEPGADIVATTINAANNNEAEIVMNKVNLLEVYYDLYRTIGKDKANEVLSDADSFALAQAIVSEGELMTSDHHEFDPVEGQEAISFCWIR